MHTHLRVLLFLLFLSAFWVQLFNSVPALAASPADLARQKASDYNTIIQKVATCPRQGQPDRERCILLAIKPQVEPHCAGRTDTSTCHQEYQQGFLIFVRNQIDFGNYTEQSMNDFVGATTVSSTCQQNLGALASQTQAGNPCSAPSRQAECAAAADKVASNCYIEGFSQASGEASAGSPDCNDFSDNSNKCNIDARADCTEGADSGNCGITSYIVVFINILSGLVGVVVIGVLVVSGIQYSASSGDPSAAAAARKKIINALLALVMFAFMYGFMQWLVPGGVL